jgi:hypothetical protein
VQGGDISNQVLPRIGIVWEGLLALRPKSFTAFTASRRNRWKKIVDGHEPNRLALSSLTRLHHRGTYGVDAITFMPEGAAPHIEDWLSEHQVLVNLIVTTPDDLAKDLVYWPHVLKVYDPDPNHSLRYGGKGRHANPTSPDFWS